MVWRFFDPPIHAGYPSGVNNVTMLRINVGPFDFSAKMEMTHAPETCAAFGKLLPFENKLIHVRWSGEAAWIPLGDFQMGVDFENHTSYPSRGDVLLYPGGISETERTNMNADAMVIRPRKSWFGKLRMRRDCNPPPARQTKIVTGRKENRLRKKTIWPTG